ncbi:hypothetical protein C2845_PM09G19060 [Panicum miliaceum]|uniref:TF-B3 domain-containing protein n=1 Tax=Panicum miliaceum TaxID=4540 RepID=A0A3L6RXV9_PANMI|nr:hypothetical protein C2845_PM09G19060 [Panicum miliaceum]
MAPVVHRARPMYAAALLSPACLHKLLVPAEFAARLGGEEGAAGGGDGAAAAAVLLVSPLGKVWRAGLRRAGGGGTWQLGGGWAGFAAAHGVEAGWSVVFRLERRGVATVRAFGAAGCLARFCTPHAGVAAGRNRPRFISLLYTDDLEKMRIPDKFVQEHLTDNYPSSQKNGCLKEYEAAAADMTDDAIGPSTVPQQGVKELVVSPVKKKRKTRNENTCLEVYRKKPNLSPILSKKVASQKKLVSTVPRHSFTKRITSYDLTSLFAVKGSFCSSVGLLGPCEITLKMSMGNTRSWPVWFNATKTYGYINGQGWKRFCRENKLKEGDCCTFSVIETTV